ncbi:MAG: hypothetical protein PHO53_00470 [Actinomycetota bacterium]|nr:hypothetical protein [Actinomycetota bacterium]
MLSEGWEIFKKALRYVKEQKSLWLFAFIIAFAGGGSQGLHLWVQSPIPAGITGLSPLHEFGARIYQAARTHWALFALFVFFGVLVGLFVFSAGVFSQASAVWGVAEVEVNGKSSVRNAAKKGWESLGGCFVLSFVFAFLITLLSLPMDFLFKLIGKLEGVAFALGFFGEVIIGLIFFLFSAVASMVLELSIRNVVTRALNPWEALKLGIDIFKKRWRDVTVTWLYALMVSLVGMLAMSLFVTVIGSPLVSTFWKSSRGESPIMVGLSILAFIFAWALSSVLAGVFAITANATWTLSYLRLVGNLPDDSGAISQNY